MLAPGERLILPEAAGPAASRGDRADDRRTPAALASAAAERPSLGVVVWRVVLVTVAVALTLWLLAAILDGFDIDDVVAGAARRVRRSASSTRVVWPALAVIVVPISVLTLGLGAIVLDAILVGLVLDLLPGVDPRRAGGPPLVIVLGLAVVTTLVSAVLAARRRRLVRSSMARRARRRAGRGRRRTCPAWCSCRSTGWPRSVLERALRSGDVPTLHRWLRDGSHRLIGWETGWSSQTGVSQCGILHGSVVDMPAFRWVDKATGTVVVSNRPASAAAIERHHSDGQGLLAHHGSSYGNLFSGDAERAVMTMSVIARRKEGRLGAGYFGYFSRPQRGDADADRPRRRGRSGAGRGVEAGAPRRRAAGRARAGRTRCCAPSRRSSAATSACSACSTTCARGGPRSTSTCSATTRSSHHSGPERADALAVLRDIDRQIGRIERAVRFAPRPYRLVVLSDHGQTQGAPFAERCGETLAEARRPAVRRRRRRATPTPRPGAPSRARGCGRGRRDAEREEAAPTAPNRSCSAPAASG